MFLTKLLEEYQKHPKHDVLLYVGPYSQTEQERAVMHRFHSGVEERYLEWASTTGEWFHIDSPEVVFLIGHVREKYADFKLKESIIQLFDKFDATKEDPILSSLARVNMIGRLGENLITPDLGLADLERWWGSTPDNLLTVYSEAG